MAARFLPNLGQHTVLALVWTIALAGCSSKAERAQACFARGMEHVQAESIPAAIASFDSALKLNPRYLDALIQKGDAYVSMRRGSDALAAYEQALAIDGRSIDAIIGRAKALTLLESPVEAQRAFNEALALTDRPDSVFVVKGWAEYTRKRFDDAHASFERGTQINPRNPDAWLAIALVGMKLVGRERYSYAPDVLPSLQRAIELRPKDPTLWAFKANIMDNLGRYEEELAVCDTLRALELPDRASWHRFPSGFAVRPGRDACWYAMGQARAGLKQWEAAVALYDSALAINQTEPSIWSGKSYALRMLGRRDESARCYARADSLWENRDSDLLPF